MEEFTIKTISRISKIKISEIRKTTSFEYLNFNMIDLAELIMAIEDKLKITVSDEIYYSKTVGKLIEQFKNIDIKYIVLTNQLN